MNPTTNLEEDSTSHLEEVGATLVTPSDIPFSEGSSMDNSTLADIGMTAMKRCADIEAYRKMKGQGLEEASDRMMAQLYSYFLYVRDIAEAQRSSAEADRQRFTIAEKKLETSEMNLANKTSQVISLQADKVKLTEENNQLNQQVSILNDKIKIIEEDKNKLKLLLDEAITGCRGQIVKFHVCWLQYSDFRQIFRQSSARQLQATMNLSLTIWMF